jgi:hypothetical protein
VHVLPLPAKSALCGADQTRRLTIRRKLVVLLPSTCVLVFDVVIGLIL